MRKGMTLVEVLIAIAALTLVLGVIGTLMAGSLRETRSQGGKNQANQLAIFIGRQLTEDSTSTVAPADNQTTTWDYGQLTTAFPGLTRESTFGDVNLYKVQIINRGSPSWGSYTGVNGTTVSMNLRQYRISVCWRAVAENSQDSGERCTQADTIGPVIPGAGGGNQAMDMTN